MVGSRQIAPNGLAHAISQQNAKIIPEHRVSHGRLHADACRYTSDNQIFDSELFQRRVEIGLVETAKTCLVNCDVARLWLEFRNDAELAVDATD